MKCKAVTFTGHDNTEVCLFSTEQEALQYVLDNAASHGISDLKSISNKAWEGRLQHGDSAEYDKVKWQIHDVELAKPKKSKSFL